MWGVISASHITNQSGWWSVRPLNQSCYLALGSLERIIILSPSGLVQTLTGGGLILTGEVHLDPSSESLQISSTFWNHQTLHFLTLTLDCLLVGGQAVRECHLEIALVRTKEHCRLFLKRTCPRESWAILALVNGWNLFFFLKYVLICIDIVTLPESCVSWLTFWICFVNLFEETINYH